MIYLIKDAVEHLRNVIILELTVRPVFFKKIKSENLVAFVPLINLFSQRILVITELFVYSSVSSTLVASACCK